MGKFSPKEQYHPATAPFTYRYPLRSPSMAKISSVAAHKRNLIAAAAAAAATAKSKSLLSAENSSRASAETGDAEKIDASSSKCNSSNNTNINSNSTSSSILKTSTSVDQLLAKPNIQEDLRRELDDLSKYSELIKKDIKTLSNIRGNVIWLLKKVTHANTLKNHKGENIVKTK